MAGRGCYCAFDAFTQHGHRDFTEFIDRMLDRRKQPVHAVRLAYSINANDPDVIRRPHSSAHQAVIDADRKMIAVAEENRRPCRRRHSRDLHTELKRGLPAIFL